MTITRRRLLTSAASAVGAGALASPGPAVAATRSRLTHAPLRGQHRTLPSGRTYWLSGAGTALVIGFPGSNLPASNLNDGVWDTGNPATTGWQAHADAHGYTLALAEPADPADNSSWNVGYGWPSGPQDDTRYAADIVADAGQFGQAFTAGFSAGGAMAWRACADRPDLFTACGLGASWAPYYPTHPMRCWHVHGGAGDTTVPIRGGTYPSLAPFTFPPAFQEASATADGSRCVLECIPNMGHSTPPWLAARWVEFFRGER